MLRDDDDFPPPQKLPKELDQWRAPIGGYAARNPNQFLVIESVLRNRGPVPMAFKLAPLSERLMILLGDHRVSIHSGMKPRDLRNSKLGWQFQQYGVTLQCLLSWLATEQAWAELEPLTSSYFAVEASRGGGKYREVIWRFDWPGGDNACLRVRTNHLAIGDAEGVNSLVSQWFRASADSGAAYGRAGLVLHPEVTYFSGTEGIFEPEAEKLIWNRALETGRPVVAGVYRANLLDPQRLDRLGGLDSLNPLIWETDGLLIEPCGTHAILWTQRFTTWYFGSHNRFTDGKDCLSPTQQALLHRFAKAGMLPVQNMDWTDELVAEWRKSKNFATIPRIQQPPQHRTRPMTAWLTHLQARPPRWLAGCAAAPFAALPAKLAEQFHSNCVHFAIKPPPDRKSLTLYGAPTRDPVVIASPVLVGSPKAERALAVFDQLQDGYDAAVIPEEDRPPRQARRVRQFKCPSCDGRLFHLRTVLEYPDDLDELGEAERARAQEFFTWFWMVATCIACNWTGIAAEIECA